MMGEKHDVRLTAAQDLPDNARVSERRSVDLADLRVEVELQPLFGKMSVTLSGLNCSSSRS